MVGYCNRDIPPLPKIPPFNSGLGIILRGSGYLGYVDSNQGFLTSISVGYMSPNPRVLNLHITSYIQYPEPLSSKLPSHLLISGSVRKSPGQRGCGGGARRSSRLSLKHD